MQLPYIDNRRVALYGKVFALLIAKAEFVTYTFL